MKSAAAADSSGSIVTVGLMLSPCASAFFFWVWYDRCLRLDFNELGRYYDAEAQVVYTDASFAWSLPAFGFLLLAMILFASSLRRRVISRSAASTTKPARR